MLEWVNKAFGAVGTEWMYFAHDKDMNLEQLEAYCLELNCVPSPILYVETLIPHVTVLEIEPLRRWLRLNEVWYIGTGVPIKEEETSDSLSLSDMWGQSEKVALCKLGREPSPVRTLILDFPASSTVRK